MSTPPCRCCQAPAAESTHLGAVWNFGAGNWSYSIRGHPRGGNLKFVLVRVGGVVLNSTLKSLVFWMVLIVVGALVWKFSSSLQPKAEVMTFTEFKTRVAKLEVASVVITGQDLTGVTKSGQAF